MRNVIDVGIQRKLRILCESDMNYSIFTTCMLGMSLQAKTYHPRLDYSAKYSDKLPEIMRSTWSHTFAETVWSHFAHLNVLVLRRPEITEPRIHSFLSITSTDFKSTVTGLDGSNNIGYT